MHVVPTFSSSPLPPLVHFPFHSRASAEDTENLPEDGGWPLSLPVSITVFRSDACAWPPYHVCSRHTLWFWFCFLVIPKFIFSWHVLLHVPLCPRDSPCGSFSSLCGFLFFVTPSASCGFLPPSHQLLLFRVRGFFISGQAGF